MIIVEGPDGAGKTTLIDYLKAATGLTVAPRVVSKGAEAMVDLKAWTEANVGEGFQPLIFDRHRLISEPIYGPILRDHQEPGFDEPNWFLEQMVHLYQLEPIMIYCLPPLEVGWANVKDDPENWIFSDSPALYRQVWGAYYNKAVTDYMFYGGTFWYDYSDPQAEELRTHLSSTILSKIGAS